MSKRALVAFLAAQIDASREEGVLFSLHMKATMMKVSDPIIFGHCVRVYFKDVFDKHGATIDELGADVNGARDTEPVFPSTPLAEAIDRGLDEIADILREAGASE